MWKQVSELTVVEKKREKTRRDEEKEKIQTRIEESSHDGVFSNTGSSHPWGSMSQQES